MRVLSKAILAGTVLALTMGAANAVDPDDAIDYRKGVFQVFVWNMAPMGAMASGDRPFDRDVLAMHAEQLNRVADMPWQGFVDGSDLGNTGALPAVWTNRARFDQLTEEFEQATANLVTAVESGAGERELRAAVGAVGRSCRTCHDDFRQ